MDIYIDKNRIGEILIPKKIFSIEYRRELDNLYSQVHFEKTNYSFIFSSFFISFFLSLVLFFIFYNISFYYFNISFLSFFLNLIYVLILLVFCFLLTYYLVLLLFLFKKKSILRDYGNEIEKALPDFIDNLISSIKGGMLFEKAILISPENNQKILTKEMMQINTKMILGSSIVDAIDDFREKYESSEIISRTFLLINEGLKEGADMVLILNTLSTNLKKIYGLDEEIKASISGFSFIVRVLTVFVAPILFSLSVTLLTFISELFIVLTEADASFLGNMIIPDEFFIYLENFSLAMIALVSIFSSLIISSIRREGRIESLKYIPLAFIFSCGIYLILKSFMIGFVDGIL